MIHAYVRVSVGREDDSVSLEYQERDIHAVFAAKYSQIIVHREAASAVKNDRPVFEDLLPGLLPGDILLAWSVDRLARNEDDLPILSRLIASGVSVRTVRDGDFLTSEAIFMFGIRLLVAAEEVRRLKQRQKARYEEGLKKGEWLFRVPFGYKRQNGRVLPDPKYSPAVPQLFSAYLSHPGGIASFVPTAKALLLPYGRIASRSYLHRILRNPFYIGEIAFRGQTGAGDFPPLLPPDLFFAVQQKLDGKSTKAQNIHDHRYRGRARCHCGRLLIGERQKGRVYYRCQNPTCPITSIREDILDNAVHAFFQSRKFTDSGAAFYLAKIREAKDDQVTAIIEQRARLTHQLAALDRRISNLIDMKADGEIDADVFQSKKQSAADDKAKIEMRLSELSGILPEVFDSTEKMLELLLNRFCSWHTARPDQKRLILNMLGSNFTVDAEKRLTMHLYDFLESFFDPACPRWWSIQINTRTFARFRQAVQTAAAYFPNPKSTLSHSFLSPSCAAATILS